METTSRGGTRTWPRIRERACSNSLYPRQEACIGKWKKTAVESAITEPAGGIPERGKSSRRTMEGKAIPNRAGPSWKERNEKGEGEGRGGWKSALWECQLRFLLPFCSKRIQERACVTYRSNSMRTNLSPPPPRILIESNKTSPIESIRVSFLLESLFFPFPPSLLFCHVSSFDPSRSYPRQDSSSRRRGRGRRREGPRRKKERGRIRKRRRRRRRRRRKEFLLLLLPPRHRLSAMSSGLRGTNASSRPPPPLFFLIYPDFVERRRQITSLAF